MPRLFGANRAENLRILQEIDKRRAAILPTERFAPHAPHPSAPRYNPYGMSHAEEVRRHEQDLKKLITNLEHSEMTVKYKNTGTVEVKGLVPLLLKHQEIGVDWMKKMEAGSNKGGLLADDMGLGKTVQAIALVLSNPPQSDYIRTTLVIAPLSLIHQWNQEILQKTDPPLKVMIYHGSNRTRNPEDYRTYDIVMTTPSTVALEYPRELAAGKNSAANRDGGIATGHDEGQYSDGDVDYEHLDTDRIRRSMERSEWRRTGFAGPLFRNTWYRVIIDEAQVKEPPNKVVKGGCSTAISLPLGAFADPYPEQDI